MQYIKCVIYKHGLFDNRVLDFSDRLTIVYGRNGSGKSLLARGLVDALWGKFSNRKLLGGEVWNSLYLDVQFSLSDAGYYRICNTVDRNYRLLFMRENEEKLLYAESKMEVPADVKVQNGFTADAESKMFNDFIRRFDGNTFINSSFIPSSLEIPRDSIIDAAVLKKILLDDDTGFYSYYTNLNKTFIPDAPEDTNVYPAVRRFDEKNRDLEKKIQITDISDSRHEKLGREKYAIQREIDDLNNSLNSLRSQKEILNKIIENLTKVDELKNEFEVIKDEIQKEQQKIKSISDMKTELDTMFPQFSDVDIADSANLDQLQEVFNDIRNLNEKIDNFYFSRELKRRRYKRVMIAFTTIAFGAAAGILAKSGLNVSDGFLLPAGIITGMSLVDAAVWQYLKFGGRDLELIQLEEEKKSFKERLMGLMEKSKVEFEDYKLTEIYELLLQYFEDYVNYTERKKDIALIKSSLKEEEYMVRIQKKLDALKMEEEIIKDEIHTSIDTLNIVDDIASETSRIEDLIQNIDAETGIVTEKIATKERILQQVENEIVLASGSNGAMASLLEEKKNLDRIMKKWKVNRNSMEFITRTLDQAIRRSEDKQLKRLLDGTLEKFNHLTGNQYITRIDDTMLLRMIRENQLSEEMTPPVVHALLLSLKFSLSEFIISGNTTIPLLIDEPFQFMDDERCNRFRDLVSYVSNTRQVIIFTHHSGKHNWGHCIEL